MVAKKKTEKVVKMDKSSCSFCKIVAGDVPALKIYEDKEFLAFLDIHPLNPGLSLIIPKKHYRWVWDVPNAGDYFEVVKKVAKALEKAFGTEWIVSSIIGEAVYHAHIGVMPRFSNDGHGGAINFLARKNISKEQMEKFLKEIKKHI